MSEGGLMGPAGPQIPYAKVVGATFGSVGEAMAARQSFAGQSNNAELRRFGVQVLMYESKEIYGRRARPRHLSGPPSVAPLSSMRSHRGALPLMRQARGHIREEDPDRFGSSHPPAPRR